MASLDQASTTMNTIQQLFNEPSDSGIQKQLSDFWAGFDDVANNPADTASRTQLLERADTLAASFNSISREPDAAADRHDQRARRDGRRHQLDGAVDRAAQQGDQGQHDLGPAGQRSRGPARPAREQARGGERRDAARGRLQPGQRRARTAPRWCRTTTRTRSRSTRRVRAPSCAGRATTPPRPSRPARPAASSTRSTRRSRTTSPSSTPSRRRCATRSTSCTARSAARSPSAEQNQTAAGNLQFDIALDGGAVRDGRPSPAPTGRARVARPRCRPRCRPRSTRRSARATRPSPSPAATAAR